MKIEYTPKAGKQFSKLDKLVQSRIKKYMSEIATLDDPLALAEKHLLQTLLVYGGIVWAITAFFVSYT